MGKLGYQVTMDKTRLKIRFAFVSKGKYDVVKVIDYDYIGLLHGRKTFNLGFGDYDLFTEKIDDHANTHNGDVYDVLNTVLNTIPLFFEEYPKYCLMVRGSDSGQTFVEACRENCKKKCDSHCKNQNRRINVYTRYVNANYDNLVNDYTFYGGNEDNAEVFEPGKKYDAVFVVRKNLTL
jgi:hypothetical protein